MIDAFVFDFDGLIIDTEWCEYVSIAEQFEMRGHRYAVEHFQQFVGTAWPLIVSVWSTSTSVRYTTSDPGANLYDSVTCPHAGPLTSSASAPASPSPIRPTVASSRGCASSSRWRQGQMSDCPA